MKVLGEKHCSSWSQLRGPGKEYGNGVWLVCSLAAKIFLSWSARKAWLVQPGAERETFTVSDYSRLIRCSPTLGQLWTRVCASAKVTLMCFARQWATSFLPFAQELN